MSEVNVRAQREETSIDILHNHSRDVQMLTSHSGISSHETDIRGSSPVRPQATDIIPKLDGPTSVHTRRRFEQEPIHRTTMIHRGGYPDESDSNSHDNRRPHDGQRPSGRRRQYHDRSGRPPDRGNDHDRGYSRRGRPPDDRGPLIMENPLMMEDPLVIVNHQMMEDPLMMKDPLMIEDPLEMEEIQDVLEDEDHQAHQDLLAQ